MAQIDLPWTSSIALWHFLNIFGAFTSVILLAGCTACPKQLCLPADVAAGAAQRVEIPPNLNVNPAETVVSPAAAAQRPTNSAEQENCDSAPAKFSLGEAIAFGMEHNPRLRAAHAAIGHAAGQEQVAFAPFLPQVDFLGQFGAVSSTLAPGVPGNEGFILASGDGTRMYAETELALQWTVYDFGRTNGRYRQSIAREHIAELELTRAQQTVEFDVATAYLGVLLARATRRTAEDAVRRADAILHDSDARRESGDALRADVLRAEVQLSESREALVLAREGELDSVARLNNAMGRNAGWPLEVVDLETQPPLPGALPELLQHAADQRPEVKLAQQAVIGAQASWQSAKAEFMPQIMVRASAGQTAGDNVVTGFQDGAGLHLDAPLYAGGAHRGQLQSADADVEAARADAQRILDAISLEVNLAFHGVTAAYERIDLSHTAVVQAEETLRVFNIRYQNGNATPTDMVDAQTALTRSQQRFDSATYNYLAALARLDYALGQSQCALPTTTYSSHSEQLPVPLPLKLDAPNSAALSFPNQSPNNPPEKITAP